MVKLADGRVLAVGGLVASDNPTALASAEIYDPRTNAWREAGVLSQPRYAHSLVLLADGQVLALGGARSLRLPGGLSGGQPVDGRRVRAPSGGLRPGGGPLVYSGRAGAAAGIRRNGVAARRAPVGDRRRGGVRHGEGVGRDLAAYRWRRCSLNLEDEIRLLLICFQLLRLMNF